MTLKYNRARVWEDLNRDEEAKEAYLALSKEHPAYVDCTASVNMSIASRGWSFIIIFFAPDVLGYLRLGSIAMKAGNFADSTDFFSEVLAIEKDNANAWSLMGLVHMKKSEWKPCQKKFERILTHTEYALLLSPVSLRL